MSAPSRSELPRNLPPPTKRKNKKLLNTLNLPGIERDVNIYENKPEKRTHYQMIDEKNVIKKTYCKKDGHYKNKIIVEDGRLSKKVGKSDIDRIEKKGLYL